MNQISKVNVGDVIYDIRDKSRFIEITYDELVSLRDNNELIASSFYRITDYITTTKETDTISAEHPFDIIVVALNQNTLSEEAYAIQSERDVDGYFSNCNLAAWKIKYCLDNDTLKFKWAFNGVEDDSDIATPMGKGVIYYMKDEYGNECPYDFKNIMFNKKINRGVIDNENGIDTFVYTFSWIDTNGEFGGVNNIYDFSIKGNNGDLKNYDGEISGCIGNEIGNYHIKFVESDKIQYGLNGNVFISNFPSNNQYGTCNNKLLNDCYSNSFGDGCAYNTFGYECLENHLSMSCRHNSFGYGCQKNKLNGSCYHNTLGCFCESNNFIARCNSNILGEYCSNNTFDFDCHYNTFDRNCSYIELGNNCQYNTFDKNCNQITFGEKCIGNTFGTGCRYIKFGDYYRYNTFGKTCESIYFCYNDYSGNYLSNYIIYNNFGDNVYRCALKNDQAATANNTVQYYNIRSGVNQISIEIERNLQHETIISR